MSILVIGAHPDDEVLGCGATIARKVEEGKVVNVAILGEGITSRYEKREQADRSLVKKLQKRGQSAANILGVNKVVFEELPDNRFDSVDFLDIVKLVEKLLDKFTPRIIYTHQSGDLNIDHEILHKAVLTAARPKPDQEVREIYGFEVPSSTEWAFSTKNFFRPSLYVNVENYVGKKIQALAEYESETEQFPHPRSTESIRARALSRGSECGFPAAEAFEVIRILRDP